MIPSGLHLALLLSLRLKREPRIQCIEIRTERFQAVPGIWGYWPTSSPGTEVLMKQFLTLTLEYQPLTSAEMK